MKDIASYLVELQEVKEDIKSSIERKGVTVTGGLSSYSSAIDNIEQGGGSCVLEDKTISITENGTTVVNPSDGYDGLSNVDVNVDVQPRLQSLTYNVDRNGEYDIIPTDDYNAIGNVKLTVDVPEPTINLENKTVSITDNGTTEVNPSDGYDGLSKVDINVDVQPNLLSFEEELTTNGVYSYSVNFPDSPYDGFGDFKIDVSVQPRLQSLTYNVDRNGEYDIIPTDDYNAIGNVKLTVDVPEPTINLEDKTISITENGTIVVNPSDGYDGLSKVTITTNVPTTDSRIAWRNGSKLGFTKLTDISTISSKFYFDDVTDMSYLFSYSRGWMTWSNKQNPPFFNCSNATTMEQMFAHMSGTDGHMSVEILDSFKVTAMNSMFWGASGLNSVVIEASNVTTMNHMFEGCDVKYINVKNTSNVTSMISMFEGCTDVKSIKLIDCSRVRYIDDLFYSAGTDLTDLGGFKNLKVGLTKYFLENCPNLTVDSLMNVINNLYDLTANGLSGQSLSFGITNLDKLTAEQIAVATNKGWTLI